jgi:hypothetical protein
LGLRKVEGSHGFLKSRGFESSCREPNSPMV